MANNPIVNKQKIDNSEQDLKDLLFRLMISIVFVLIVFVESSFSATCTCADNCAFGYSEGAVACAIGQLIVLLALLSVLLSFSSLFLV